MQSIEDLLVLHPWIVMYSSTEFACILARSSDILIVLKRKEQRTPAEQEEIERGLARSVFLELLLLAPIRATLVLICLAHWLTTVTSQFGEFTIAFNGILGILSYWVPTLVAKALRPPSQYTLLNQEAVEDGFEELPKE